MERAQGYGQAIWPAIADVRRPMSDVRCGQGRRQIDDTGVMQAAQCPTRPTDGDGSHRKGGAWGEQGGNKNEGTWAAAHAAFFVLPHPSWPA